MESVAAFDSGVLPTISELLLFVAETFRTAKSPRRCFRLVAQRARLMPVLH